MKLALHARGGPGIGAGHLVRCLAIAEEAVRRGWTVALTEPVGVPWLRAEFAALGATQEPTGADVLLVDSYTDAPDPGSALLVNVEDGTFGRRAADIVLDGNLAIGPRPADGSGLLLRGPEYAMLRARVRTARRPARPFGSPPRVAISLGGSELAEPASLRLLELLEATELPMRCTVYGDFDCPDWVRVRPPSPDLPTRLAAADLVCTAAGITLLETSCIGTPMALLCLVDNQAAGYARAVDLGLATPLGSSDRFVDKDTLAAALRDPDTLTANAERARTIVDGHGAARVLDAITEALP